MYRKQKRTSELLLLGRLLLHRKLSTLGARMCLANHDTTPFFWDTMLQALVRAIAVVKPYFPVEAAGG